MRSAVRFISVGSGSAPGRTMDAPLKDKKPGDQVRVLVSRRGTIRELEVLLGKRPERSFAITPIADPTPLQAAVLKDWLGE